MRKMKLISILDFVERVDENIPQGKIHLTISIDSEVAKFFRDKGRGYQTHMNAVLKTYMQACLEKKTKTLPSDAAKKGDANDKRIL